MKTQSVIEQLLYLTNNDEKVRIALETCHILNDTDRNYQPVEHSELFFMKEFKNFKIVEVIEDRIQVFLLGTKKTKLKFNVLFVNGFITDKLTLNKCEFRDFIKDRSKKASKSFIKPNMAKKIIYIDPNDLDNIVIFNRDYQVGNIYSKGKWFIGQDTYKSEKKFVNTDYYYVITEIINEVYNDTD